MGEQEVQTYVFFDCEATGLTGCRVTEISFVAVHKDEYNKYAKAVKKHLTNEDKTIQVQIKYPRVLNKMTLAVYPMTLIPLNVEDLTGLNNYNLEHQSKFQNGPAQTIHRFLNGLQKPVCLIAHNGNKFDFPLLKKEMSKSGLELPPDLLCCDSIVFFRHYYRVDRGPTKISENVFVEKIDQLQTPTKSTAFPNSSAFFNTPEKSPNNRSANTTKTTDAFNKKIAQNQTSAEDAATNKTSGRSPNTRSARTRLVEYFPKAEKAAAVVLSADKLLTAAEMLEASSVAVTPTKNPNVTLTPAKTSNVTPSPYLTPPRSGRKRTYLGGLARASCAVLTCAGDSDDLAKDPYYEKLKVAPTRYSLPSLHMHLFGTKPEESHGAEIDSLILLKTTAVFGTSFVQWTERKSTLMADVVAKN